MEGWGRRWRQPTLRSARPESPSLSPKNKKHTHRRVRRPRQRVVDVKVGHRGVVRRRGGQGFTGGHGVARPAARVSASECAAGAPRRARALAPRPAWCSLVSCVRCVPPHTQESGKAGVPARTVATPAIGKEKKKSDSGLAVLCGSRVASQQKTLPPCALAKPDCTTKNTLRGARSLFLLFAVCVCVTEKEEGVEKKRPTPACVVKQPSTLSHTLAPAPHSSYWLSSNCSASMVESMKSSFSHPAGPAGGACASRMMR